MIISSKRKTRITQVVFFFDKENNCVFQWPIDTKDTKKVFLKWRKTIEMINMFERIDNLYCVSHSNNMLDLYLKYMNSTKIGFWF